MIEQRLSRDVYRKLGLMQVSVTGGQLDHSVCEKTLTERGGSELVIALVSSSGFVSAHPSICRLHVNIA